MSHAAAVVGGVVLLLLPLASPAHGQVVPGEAIVADYGAGGGGDTGALFRVDLGTGVVVPLAAGPPLVSPAGVAFGPAGELYVADFGAPAVLRVDSATGLAVPLVSGPPLVEPRGLAVGTDGTLWVAARGGGGSILRLDPRTGAATPVAAGPPLVEPNALALDPGGALVVADVRAAGSGAVLRVDPATGARLVLSTGGPLRGPRGLALGSDGDLWVTDDGGPDLPGRVLRVSATTGLASAVAPGASFVQPRGVAAVPGGALVTDRGPAGPGGALLRVDAATGSVATVASGPPFVDPYGVAIVPTPTPPPPSVAEQPQAVRRGVTGGVGDTTPPLLSSPRLTPSRFVPSPRGARSAGASGTVISYRVSEPTRVTFTVKRAVRSRVRGCRARAARHRTRARCLAFRRARGGFAKVGGPGLQRLRWNGRLRGRALPPGRYGLYARARDRAGNPSRQRHRAFRIARR